MYLVTVGNCHPSASSGCVADDCRVVDGDSVARVVPNDVLLRHWRGIDSCCRRCAVKLQHGIDRLIQRRRRRWPIQIGKRLGSRGNSYRLIPSNSSIKNVGEVVVGGSSPRTSLVARANKLYS